MSAPIGKPVESETAWRVGLLSVGGIIGGLAAATCCAVPFALFLAGISGAWISYLTAFAPYRLYFAGFGVACIGIGFYFAYRKPAAACAEGSYCAQHGIGRMARTGLWIATVVVAAAIASPYLIARWL